MTTRYEGYFSGWRKSPYSTGGGNCVEVAVWQQSPYGTNGGNCVEVGVAEAAGAARKAGTGKLFVLRDSKDPDGPRLYFTPSEWEAFARGLKAGAFDDLA